MMPNVITFITFVHSIIRLFKYNNSQFASCIDQNITPSAFARVVRIGQKEIRWTLTMIPRDGQQCPRARGHMLRIFMTLPSLYRRGYTSPRSTILPSCNTRASDGNVATIVLLASRRGIISAHCHRLIEFGIDRIAHVDLVQPWR